MMDDDTPRIWVDIRLTRKLGSMSPDATRMWQGAKGVIFFVALALTIVQSVYPAAGIPANLRIACALMIAWLVYELIIARRSYGVSHILVTTKGMLFTEENVYVRWEDIESYQVGGGLLRVRPTPGHGAKGLFAPKDLDVPLSDQNRELLLDLCRENGVPPWKPQ